MFIYVNFVLCLVAFGRKVSLSTYSPYHYFCAQSGTYFGVRSGIVSAWERNHQIPRTMSAYEDLDLDALRIECEDREIEIGDKDGKRNLTSKLRVYDQATLEEEPIVASSIKNNNSLGSLNLREQLELLQLQREIKREEEERQFREDERFRHLKQEEEERSIREDERQRRLKEEEEERAIREEDRLMRFKIHGQKLATVQRFGQRAHKFRLNSKRK